MIQLFHIKTRNLGFAFCQPPKKVLTEISHPKQVTTKFQTQKKSSDRKFQTQKRASHIPVTYFPEYPPWGVLLPLLHRMLVHIAGYNPQAFCPVSLTVHWYSFILLGGSEGDTVRVKCLAQEHNTNDPARALS